MSEEQPKNPNAASGYVSKADAQKQTLKQLAEMDKKGFEKTMELMHGVSACLSEWVTDVPKWEHDKAPVFVGLSLSGSTAFMPMPTLFDAPPIPPQSPSSVASACRREFGT